MVPLTIVDNFYDDPYWLRELALKQEIIKDKTMNYSGNYPGYRSKSLFEIDSVFAHIFVKKILSLFFDVNKDVVNYDFKSFFQIIPERFENGWCHADNYDIAGILYLTPDAPKKCGTLLCERVYSFDENLDSSLRDKFYRDNKVDMNLYRKTRDKHNSQFETTVEISNVFNRLVVYDGKKWHRENYFFGTDKYNSRMTLVFFSRLEPKGCNPPIIRSRFEY
jgi:hypothetical protein